MRYVDLDHGDEVVLDVGHSGGVTALAALSQAILSGGDDGYVYIRDRDGRSLVPPAHLPAVTTLVPLGGTTTAVVGTIGHTYGLDLTTGDHRPLAGLEDTWTRTGVALGSRAVLGCADGSIRTLAFGEGVQPFAALTAPAKAIARHGEDAVAVCADDGSLTYLTSDGDERWRAQLMPGEVETVACRPGTVVVGGAGPTPGTGRIIAFDADGQELGRVDIAAPVSALASGPAGIVIALGDGTVRRIGESVDDTATLGEVEGLGVESLAVAGAELWYGTADGQVGRLDPPLALPASSSGVLALTMRSDGEAAVGSDGTRLLTYDLQSGEVTTEAEVEAVIALAYAAADTDDLVVAYPDGRLERRRAPDYGTVTGEGRVAFRPVTLGYVDELVVAMGDDEYTAVTADRLEAAELPPDRVDGVALARRTGFAFTGWGPLSGIDVAVIETTDLVVARPGVIGVTRGAEAYLRIWNGGRWLR